MPRVRRGWFNRTLNTLSLPIRALLVREKNKGIFISLRDERMEAVREHCSGKLLDLGCGPGNLFVKEFNDGNGIGADVFSYEGIEVLVDSTALPFGDCVFDTVTMIAVGGHIPRRIRTQTFGEIFRVLRHNGKLVMTEGEVITQTLHHRIQFFLDRFRKEKNMDTVRGMEVDEEFAMPHSEIQTYLRTFFGNFTRIRFQLGLNNVYVATKRIHSD